MAHARRLFQIGYDGMNHLLLRRFLAEGCLPTFQALLARGSLNRLLPTIPAWTPTNWSSVATGAPSGSHRLGGWTVRPKTAPWESPRTMSWDFQALGGTETLWEIADQAGRKTLITHYPPGCWGAPLAHGYVVAPGVHDAPFSYALSMRYFVTSRAGVRTSVDQPGAVLGSRSTDVEEEGAPPGSSVVRLEPAVGWANVSPGDLVTTLPIVLRGGKQTDQLHLLTRRDASGGFSRVAVCREADGASAFIEVPARGWSAFGFFAVGPERKPASVRFRIMHADPAVGTLQLVRSVVYGTEGFAQPAGLDRELLEACGPFYDFAAVNMVQDDEHLDAWLDEMRMMGEWEVKVAKYVQQTRGWDLHFSHWHPFDWINHASVNDLDPRGPTYDPRRAEWLLDAQRRTYQLADDILRQFLDLEADGDLICLQSDHGMAPTHRMGSIPHRLIDAGLLVLDPTGQPDWSRSKVYVIPERGAEIYVNLAGREPMGIVPPDAYERVQEEIIDALLDWRDPLDRRRPIALALKLQDAQIIGYWGDISGDVVMVMNRGYGWGTPIGGGTIGKSRTALHGSQIPTSETPELSNLACCILSGPGVKIGYERDWQRWGLMRMIDMAPTFAHLLQLRTPRRSMGAVLWDLLDE